MSTDFFAGITPGSDVDAALADAEPKVFWTDRPDAPAPRDPVTGTSADLVVVGGGFTGLWTAILAKQQDPSTDVVLLESQHVGYGASGRNGGFVSDSLTHGLAHGSSRWPSEVETLVELGRRNVAEIASTLAANTIDADLRLVGKTTVAVSPYQLEYLRGLAELHRAQGDEAVLLDAAEMRADVDSPTYLGGVRLPSAGGLVDPGRLTFGLARLADSLGVRRYDRSPVSGLTPGGGEVEVRTPTGTVRAGRVALATNAYPAPLKRVRPFVLPVYDHVLVTEPLSSEQWDALGWAERQGLTDAGNRFHYYRPTADGRILWGGYDALYHFGGRVRASYEQRKATHRRLAAHFFATFPQLEGVRFTHRWGGVIDSTSRFTPVFGTASRGRIAYAVGYTGLGVASARFGGQVMLDLLAGRDTEATRLGMVRRRPVPFPPEPLRWPVVQLTRGELIRSDARGGRRGPWLRLLDRFGVGFDS
ncbi:NAD(P)/FAD-dependent oxidoreductase [Cryptosporangium aurantiacum]|uniref:Glycine/D-amino acid oxidase n=1 Tax=Cryptosporangium aurantiacum TaxID=134849 RepID=A0A1M7H2R7_9ACTN|nr:FAD-binding oxidoreductase [Cryptosporangium aurantiacum]SHM22738.1 Glycine/D-amino acid oxidase [Cryptosporangium aurantiacum]